LTLLGLTLLRLTLLGLALLRLTGLLGGLGGCRLCPLLGLLGLGLTLVARGLLLLLFLLLLGGDGVIPLLLLVLLRGLVLLGSLGLLGRPLLVGGVPGARGVLLRLSGPLRGRGLAFLVGCVGGVALALRPVRLAGTLGRRLGARLTRLGRLGVRPPRRIGLIGAGVLRLAGLAAGRLLPALVR